ncbi:snare-like protein [Martensiomyces pterosporus]|nr:snare-like protein [Martensiomyces pterosporus]
MVVYNIYIFDRHCECVFYTEWNRQNSPLATNRPRHGSNSQSTAEAEATGRTSNTFGGTQPSTNQTLRSGQHVPGGDGSDRQSLDSQRQLVWPTSSNASAHGSAGGSQRNVAMEEEAKLVYGVVFSTRNIVNKLSGKDGPQGGNPGGFMSFATNTYRLHYYEAPSGIKIVLNTDTATKSMQHVLEMIYRNIYVEYVVKNPLFHPNPRKSTPIENDYFRAVLNNYIRDL